VEKGKRRGKMARGCSRLPSTGCGQKNQGMIDRLNIGSKSIVGFRGCSTDPPNGL
jgi:hypothetical protein